MLIDVDVISEFGISKETISLIDLLFENKSYSKMKLTQTIPSHTVLNTLLKNGAISAGAYLYEWNPFILNSKEYQEFVDSVRETYHGKWNISRLSGVFESFADWYIAVYY